MNHRKVRQNPGETRRESYKQYWPILVISNLIFERLVMYLLIGIKQSDVLRKLHF